MALEVRTANGRKFHRAGLAFGRDAAVVGDQVLKQKLGPPSYAKGATVESVLLADAALICRPINADPGRNGKKD